MAFLKTDKSKIKKPYKLSRKGTNHAPGAQQRLYLIEFRDDSGYYIKCGKASGSSCGERLSCIIESYFNASGGCCPYAKVLRDVEVTDVFKRETEFHHNFKNRRHYPTHSFSGYTEMFAITKEEALVAFDEIVGKQYNRATTKKCYTCSRTKSTIEFHTNKAKKDGLNHDCKECTLHKQRSYSALPYRMYSNQIEHSKTRGHPRPEYTRQEFKLWVTTQGKYNKLYEQYKASDYDKRLVPSVDRLDPMQGYNFSNIELVTFIENMKRNGDVQKKVSGKPVIAIDKHSGKAVAEFQTQNECAKVLKLCTKKICSKVDKVLSYGWMATIGDYQLVSKHNENNFMRNGWLKPRYRYKRKDDVPENNEA